MATDVQQRLPRWAGGCEWLPGACRCGARLIRVECYCGHHVVCAKSSFDAVRCPLVPAAEETTDHA